MIGHTRRRILQLSAAAAATMPFGAFAQPTSMKIGIVGSGRIGGTIGELWAKAGHKVFFSSRHPEELKPLVEQSGPNAQAGTVQQAVAFGDVIFIAVPYAALPEVGRDNAAGLKGKIVLNASNPIAGRDGEMAAAAREKGVDKADQEYLPGTRLVRAFNSTGAGRFASEAHKSGEKLGVAIASDDAEALKVAAQLVHDAGYEPVPVSLARAVEFAPGAELFGRALPVSELRKALGVAQ